MDITLTTVRMKSIHTKKMQTIIAKERIGKFSTGSINFIAFSAGQHIFSKIYINLLSVSSDLFKSPLFETLDIVTFSSIMLIISLDLSSF